jgi:hypothetical protein
MVEDLLRALLGESWTGDEQVITSISWDGDSFIEEATTILYEDHPVDMPSNP